LAAEAACAAAARGVGACASPLIENATDAAIATHEMDFVRMDLW